MTLKITGHIAQRVFNTPLLIEPGKAEVILNVLLPRFSDLQYDPTVDPEQDAPLKKRKEFQTQDSIAILPIYGTLIHRGGFMDAMSGLTSYQSLKEDLMALAMDDAVKAIVLDVDSPGGEVAGAFDTAQMIRDIHDNIKPVWAIANESMYSAAYLLASSAGKVFMAQTAGVGSIGVIMQHVDFSKANEKAGIKVTNIFAGDKKVDFSPDFPLSPEAKAEAQAEVDIMYEMFVQHVAIMRDMDPQAVRDTQAGIFMAADAMDTGLVNNISTLEELVYNLSLEVETQSASLIMQKGNQDMNMNMFKKKKEASATKPEADETVEQKKEGAEDTAAKTEEDPAASAADPSAETPAATEADEKASPAEDAASAQSNVPAEIAEYAASVGQASMAGELIRNCTTLEAAKAILNNSRAVKINKICRLAGKAEEAAAFISSNKTFEAVQKELVTLLADDSAKTDVSGTQDPKKVTEDFTMAGDILAKDAERRAANQQTKK